ncbi:haloacid dehalogenase [Kosmotoga arenicorallina S304]|uniref:Haloacid dehalogenase n=1 Tax=Kosmotoga arenicorallina S304 TaxID=1453497 RepID=A0A176JYZ7_9BACT|nr:YjjG family noncanonical pyrimidine nucleotidase [Kosmotoga arenicorallina]OAA29176.1 haloacid dehalogenase [Kosmotoga arenicorallina S304]
MKYSIVYFDLDHTLFDFDRTERESLEVVLENASVEATPEMIKRYKEINATLWSEFSGGKYTKEFIAVERFKRFFSEFKVNRISPEEASTLFVKELSKRGYFLPGAEDFLKKLKEAGQRMAVITNGIKKVQESRKQVAKLERFFEFLLTSEEAGKPKPFPDIFHLAASKSGVPLEESVYVGDNLETDYAGAKNAGINFILYQPEPVEKTSGLDLKVARNYDELFALLAD